ncbi:hypothetical protein BGZ58_008498 [Dissophora ornata]|nr:hypothetical protein BGZ58_008498 [Dissophora ornata]
MEPFYTYTRPNPRQGQNDNGETSTSGSTSTAIPLHSNVVPIIDDLVDNTHEPGELRDDGEDGEELMESLLENSTIIYAGEGNDSLYFDVAGANRPEAALDRTQGSGSVLQSPTAAPLSAEIDYTSSSGGLQRAISTRTSESNIDKDFREQYRRAVENSMTETEADIGIFATQGSIQAPVILNTLAEQEADMTIQQERQKLLTKSTTSMYQRYQRHWVVHPKSIPRCQRFLQEVSALHGGNVAEEPDPAKGIQPLRINPKSRSVVQPVYDPNLPLPSYITVDAYIKAAIDLYVT